MPTAGGTKVCTRCGEEKLITAFHFLNSKSTSDGDDRRRRSDCKICHSKTMVEYRRRRVANEGEPYLETERDRIHSYIVAPTADVRRAVERARHAALKTLKARHPNEYSELEAEFRQREGVS
jgi:hypothetical protein